MPGRSSSTAPASRCRCREAGAEPRLERGPGLAVYSVVPDPAASATNACVDREAAVSAMASSPADSAGRSAAAPPGRGLASVAAACSAPAVSASLRPAARQVSDDGRTSGRQPASARPGRRSPRLRRRPAGRLRRPSPCRPPWRERAASPVGVGKTGQPGLGHGEYLDGDHHSPTRSAAYRCHSIRSCLDSESRRTGRLAP